MTNLPAKFPIKLENALLLIILMFRNTTTVSAVIDVAHTHYWGFLLLKKLDVV